MRKAYLAWFIVCLVWGTTYLGIRISLETIPPLLMAGLRWSAAGALLIAVFAARGDRLPPPREWGSLTFLGVLLLGFGNGAVVWAEQTIPSGLTAVLVATVPFWMVGLEACRRDAERIKAMTVAGLVVGFGGIVLLVWPELHAADRGAFLRGVWSTQIAGVGWAIGSLYSRRRGHHENVLIAAAFQMLFGGLVLLAGGLALGEWSTLTFNTRTTTALVYLVGVGSVGGFSAYAYALKHLPVATVSLYAYINPVIAVVLGMIVLKEPFNARMAVAAAVVLIGIALVRGTTS